MPKGKRKDPDNLPAFKMTTFHIPPQRVHQPFAPGGHPKLEPQTRADLLFPTSATSSRVNTKNMSSAYQKQESQTTWARRTAGQGEKRKREAAEAEATELPGVRRPTLVISPRSADLPPIVCWLVFRALYCSHLSMLTSLQIPSGSKTIVIHPGSETLRIGRAVDYAPKEVPMALARRRRRRRTMSGLEGESSGKGKERDHRPDEDDSMEVNGVEPASKEVRTHPRFRPQPSRCLALRTRLTLFTLAPPFCLPSCPCAKGRRADRLLAVRPRRADGSAPAALLSGGAVARRRLQRRRPTDQGQRLQRPLSSRLDWKRRALGRPWRDAQPRPDRSPW